MLFQTPPKDFHLLRGFSSKGLVIPKKSFQTWSIYRTLSFELPKLKEYKSSSHLTPCTILYVNKLTMLFAGVLNSWLNSLQPGGHDANQVNKEMPKDANLPNEKSSQVACSSSQTPFLISFLFLPLSFHSIHKYVLLLVSFCSFGHCLYNCYP